MARRRRRLRWRLKRKWPLFVAVLLVLAAGGTAWGYWALSGRQPPAAVRRFVPSPPLPGRTNVLLLGTDARAGEPSKRTDVMILASIDPVAKEVDLLSVPRDTRVDLPGRGTDKINDADVYGGPDEAMAVVSKLLGIKLDYYVLADFDGFQEIVNTLGGLTIDVPYNMYHYDPMDGGIYSINLKKGVQHLNGTEALEFVRFRDTPTGDIGRTELQQEFLTALIKKMMRPSSLPKLVVLAPEAFRYVHTNLSLTRIVALARVAADLKNLKVVHETLPGFFETVDGESYWGVDPAQAQAVAAAIMDGKASTTPVIEETPPGLGGGPSGVSGATYGKTAGVSGAAYGKTAGVSRATYAKKAGPAGKQAAKSAAVSTTGTGSGTPGH